MGGKIKEEALEMKEQDSDLVLLLTGYETLAKLFPLWRLRFPTCNMGTTETTRWTYWEETDGACPVWCETLPRPSPSLIPPKPPTTLPLRRSNLNGTVIHMQPAEANSEFVFTP